MMIEQRESVSIHFFPEVPEQKTQLAEWLDERGIKAVLFDLDDTLLDTNSLICRKLDEFTSFLYMHVPNTTHEIMDRMVEEADEAVYKTHSVSKERWNALVTHVLDQCHSSPELYREGTEILLSMYDTVPDLIPGALSTLLMFRQALPHMGLVTHANEAYTALKLRKTGLQELFDHVEIVDERGNKEPRHWGDAIRSLGVQPEEVLVIGDSIKGDIQAARSAGVNYLVALPSPWEVYRQGELPEGVIRADGIGKVVETLLKN